MNPVDRLRELLPGYVITEKIPRSRWPIKEPATFFVMSRDEFHMGHWIPDKFIGEPMAKSLREQFESEFKKGPPP